MQYHRFSYSDYRGLERDFPTPIALNSSDLSYVLEEEGRFVRQESAPNVRLSIEGGKPSLSPSTLQLAWHEIPVTQLFLDEQLKAPFSGTILPEQKIAISSAGDSTSVLYGQAVENSAPLTQKAFEKRLGVWGGIIVLVCVLLFGISTAISWSYYGDRCIHYLLGEQAIVPFKVLYGLMHFVGAVSSLNVIWGLGDITMALVTIPNVFAIVLLSREAKKLTDAYFEKHP